MTINVGPRAPVFIAGQKQHERLGIPKEGLPLLSEVEFENLLVYLWRYEEALGLGGPGDASETESAQDSEVFAEIIASHYGVSLGEARAILVWTVKKHQSGGGLKNTDNEGQPTVFWEPDDALAFVTHLSGASSAAVATFLYIHQSDELAEGLFKPDKDWIQRTYEWALAHTI